ncbi:DUF5134 domain-containing protein [Nocardia sp. NPDC047038]|uniref:DUF5134 domain-containing protein n=1 Tax=Nocardia sp. NPDC047038 TaxID=3154338 RepID=UPI0033F550EB
MTSAHHTLTRFNRPDGLRDLVRGTVPPEWRTGPILGIAPYPDVLVTKAAIDGNALELVPTGRPRLQTGAAGAATADPPPHLPRHRRDRADPGRRRVRRGHHRSRRRDPPYPVIGWFLAGMFFLDAVVVVAAVLRPPGETPQARHDIAVSPHLIMDVAMAAMLVAALGPAEFAAACGSAP